MKSSICILIASFLFFFFNYIANAVFSVKLYFIGFTALGLYLIRINYKSSPSTAFLFLISVVLFLHLFYQIATDNLIDGAVIQSILLGLLPLSISLVPIKRFHYIKILKVLSYLSIPAFCGMLIEISGFSSSIIGGEITATNGVAHRRGSSIFSVSLVYAAVVFISLLCSLYLIEITGEKKYYIFALLSMSMIMDSQSRRVIVPAVVVVSAFIFYYQRQARLLTLVFIVLMVLADISFSHVSALERLISSFDFVGDQGNVSRILIAKDVIDRLFEHPFGTGAGSYTNIAKNQAEIYHNSFIAESFYLVVIGEVGIYAVIVFIAAFFAVIRLDRLRRIVFLYPVAMEGIFGLSYFIPFYALAVSFFLFANVTDE